MALAQRNPQFYRGKKGTSVYEKITSNDRMVKVWRPHYQRSKEVINEWKERISSQRAFHMEMPVSHRICAKVSEESDIRDIKSRHREFYKSIAQFMGYLKGKSTLMIFDRHANLKYKYGSRHFWCGGIM